MWTDMNSSQYMFLLIMRCSFAFASIFNNKKNNLIQQQEFYDSVKDDYRLKNFYCLYSLVELIYDDFLKSSSNKAINNESNINNKEISQELSNNINSLHLISSLNSLKKLFKIDEYFELE